jgi:hypothetical protein
LLPHANLDVLAKEDVASYHHHHDDDDDENSKRLVNLLEHTKYKVVIRVLKAC